MLLIELTYLLIQKFYIWLFLLKLYLNNQYADKLFISAVFKELDFEINVNHIF